VSNFAMAVKRLLVGRPFRSDRLAHTLLPKRIALPVFASDPMSSVAYAPEEILLVLSVAGASAYLYSPWIALTVAIVMLAVVASYRQNVRVYTSGGGDFEVAKVNHGPRWGLVVASALLVDYVLTVAVSIASAAANIGSAVPFVATHKVEFAVGAILVLTAVNRVRDPHLRVRRRHPEHDPLGAVPHVRARGRGARRERRLRAGRGG
jgi:hypothetical protein